MAQTLPYLMFAIFVLCGQGCATVFTGTSDDVYFNSEPRGALVIIDGHPLGRTPLITKVPRRLRTRYVMYKLEGYESISMPFENRFNAVSVVNILWWPGLVIDLATGAVVKAEYDTYYAELEPERAR